MKTKSLLLLGLLPFALTACNPTVKQSENGGNTGTTSTGSVVTSTGNDNGNTNGGTTIDDGGNTNKPDDDGNGNTNGGGTVVSTKDAYTVLIYMCGSDLESDRSQGGLATMDLEEILSVKGQPEGVNIVVQTGGASRWASTSSKLGISATKSQRWHVENQKLVKDEESSKVNMGKSSTLENFLTWGIEKYPAEKTGVILWNHGGAMHGVCYDENYNSDALTNSEVNTALKNTFTKLNRTEKLEFIGYDACLMAVQDIAEFNSHYFNYMVSSQEAEAGYGWDYDNWVGDLYAKKPTTEVLKAVCDSFIEDNNVDYYGEYSTSYNDQTLSVLDLSKMDAYKNAFESFGEALKNKLTSSQKSTVKTAFNKAKRYCVDDDKDEDYFATYDVKDLLTKVRGNSTLNPGNTVVDKALSAFNDLVIYNAKGAKAGNSNGLCCYYAATKDADKSSVYTTAETNFTNWISFNTTFGY